MPIKTYTQPPPQKIVYNAPISKVKFNYLEGRDTALVGNKDRDTTLVGNQTNTMYETQIINVENKNKKE